MGIAMIRPEDCLRNPTSAACRTLKTHRIPKPNRSPSTHNTRAVSKPHSSPPSANPKRREVVMVDKVQNRGLVMEKVKILKRGEEITETVRRSPDPKGLEEELKKTPVCPADPIAPRSDISPVQIRTKDSKVGFAGSVFTAASPPPSSLPRPSISLLKKALVDNTALTSEAFRCLLRLDVL